tara:strand:+ start:1734 stop:2768 length:1035 start_codon:yes stop_codon:yes gene_type:complete
MIEKKKILITGAAGFIGYHLCRKLISNNFDLIGIDNINDYYDINLKKSRLEELEILSNRNKSKWKFQKCELKDYFDLKNIFEEYKPNVVVNLAAQAGVRYSLENPNAYIDSNIYGFLNILECCRKYKIQNLIYASSSSVYGGNTKIPFSEKDSVDHPVSLYAATKKSNELMAHTYSHLFGLPAIGLRFFTVYGPWGRPDMSPMIFTKAILEKKQLKIFNKGDMFRDFTFIDDVIEIIKRLLDKPAQKNNNFDYKNPNPDSSWAPHRIFNVGNSDPVYLMDFIRCLEDEIGKKAIKKLEDMQPGDVKTTSADTSSIEKYIDYKPNTELKVGIKKFFRWYKSYYLR